VIGGGPEGMLAVLHCLENCLMTGGVMKWFADDGSKTVKSQVVRLDSRWVAMLRFHCGTIFEDFFIPSSDEVDSQRGSIL
jgi:hypothetical protein